MLSNDDANGFRTHWFGFITKTSRSVSISELRNKWIEIGFFLIRLDHPYFDEIEAFEPDETLLRSVEPQVVITNIQFPSRIKFILVSKTYWRNPMFIRWYQWKTEDYDGSYWKSIRISNRFRSILKIIFFELFIDYFSIIPIDHIKVLHV